MKLILREYLSSLREREELDAILPDLLSELGYAVYSRPQRGTTQHGVDVAAISPDNSQERKVCLFSIKRGDLTRQDWDGTPQALRSSLNEILDVYIPTRIPIEHRGLRIVVCVCLGGDVQEQVRANFEGFIKAHTTDTIAFEEWNGDKLASLLLEGVLREDLLPKQLRSHFQKAVALLDEPDVSYRHFSRLAAQLRTNAVLNARSRVRAARQLYICLWILYVWGRDIDNIEAPYLASELCILNTWELLRPMIGIENADHLALARVLDQLIRLHLIIADQFIARRIAPGAQARDALAMAVNSRTSVDVNIKLFDIIGRIAMAGLWVIWLSEQQQGERTDAITSSLAQFFEIGMSIVENNGALRLPVSDDQTTDIALFGLLCLYGAPDGRRLTSWLASMVERYELSIRSRSKYPTSFSEYADLVAHPRQRSDEYFKEATAGSTLVPFLASWTMGLGRPDLATRLATLRSDKLQHCTMQLWTPGEDSEEHLYINSDIHGRAICDLPILDEGKDLLETIADACTDEHGFQSLSAARTSMWPIILLACRHWRLPVPPNFYIESLRTFFAQNNGADRGDESSQTSDGELDT